ncbi:hypothetical protein KFK09_002774 [Dendrobium nobile]|uniref:Uncharacterized protein n=1 Tax=Dendrobium nobile TaxID=94219 RepID=A0A8T3C5U7_DENNO|nr:hypothetical protein KFK09_002774 [Dendrobium nobile]
MQCCCIEILISASYIFCTWFLLDAYEDKHKACFLKHLQWPPESFRPARLESLCCLTIPSLDV